MSQALYRKWRPHQWDEVVSQEHVVQTLRNAVRTGRTGHAYLLAGPRGTGKTTTARLLAKALNCLAEDPGQRPCDRCPHCEAINAGRFMDLIEIDAASNTSVDDVRALRDKINFAPTQGRYKVYIIDEVHMLSTAAFNALLKTLEEPPPHAIFILATTEIYKIPATVLSRCQRYEFRRIPVSAMVQYLREKANEEHLEIEEEALTLIARQATGAMRDAISLLDQLASTGSRVTLAEAQTVLGTATSAMVVELIEAVLARKAGDGLQIVQNALDAGTDARQFARQVVDYLRGLLLIRMGNSDALDTTAEMRAAMARHASAFETARLLETIRMFNAAAVDTRSSWHPGLGLELAIAEAMEEKAAASTQQGAGTQPAAVSTQPAVQPTPAQRDAPAGGAGVDQSRIAAARAAAASAPAAERSQPAAQSQPPAQSQPRPQQSSTPQQSQPRPQPPAAQPDSSGLPPGVTRGMKTTASAQAEPPKTQAAAAASTQPAAAGTQQGAGTQPAAAKVQQAAAQVQPGAKAPAAQPPAAKAAVEPDDPFGDMPDMPPFDPTDEDFQDGGHAGGHSGPARTYERPSGGKPPSQPGTGPVQPARSQPVSGGQAARTTASQPGKPGAAQPQGSGQPPVKPQPPAQQAPAAKPAAGTAGAPPAAQPPAQPGRVVTQQEVQQNWPRVRAMIKKKNALSEAALNSCKSIVIKDNTLVLGFSTEVVKSKMETPENMELLRLALQAILGANLAIRCVVTNATGGTASDANVEGDGMVGTALDLGAKIVFEE